MDIIKPYYAEDKSVDFNQIIQLKLMKSLFNEDET